MHLREIMKKNVITVTDEESIANAARKMREANVGCLVVTNNGRSVEGIITDRDMTVDCLSQAHNSEQCQVSRHMTSPVISAEPNWDVLGAVHLMTEKQIKRLPVVENGQLIGLVSFSDIAQALEPPMRDLLFGMGAARRLETVPR